jgi:hypothetical protein
VRRELWPLAAFGIAFIVAVIGAGCLHTPRPPRPRRGVNKRRQPLLMATTDATSTAVRAKEFHFPVTVDWLGERRVAARADGKPAIEITTPPVFRGHRPIGLESRRVPRRLGRLLSSGHLHRARSPRGASPTRS